MGELSKFAYNEHRVEIILPVGEHLIGNFWLVQIDDILQRNVLYSSLRVAAEAPEI